jgi:hypothetical protein
VFIGHASATADMVGVELDPVTARIAATLNIGDYPHRGFERTRLPGGSFVAAVGNVPFGGFRLFDPECNPGGVNVDDYFIVCALRLTSPGGIVAVFTSTGTLDKLNQAARRKMHAYGDQVGAAQLPSGAMSRVAGADVVIDLVILRRRRDGQTPADLAAWETLVEKPTDAAGRYGSTGGSLPPRAGARHRGRRTRPHTGDDLLVRSYGRDLPAALAEAVDRVVADATTRGRFWTPIPATNASPRGCGWSIHPGQPVAWTRYPDVTMSRTLTWHPAWA